MRFWQMLRDHTPCRRASFHVCRAKIKQTLWPFLHLAHKHASSSESLILLRWQTIVLSAPGQMLMESLASAQNTFPPRRCADAERTCCESEAQTASAARRTPEGRFCVRHKHDITGFCSAEHFKASWEYVLLTTEAPGCKSNMQIDANSHVFTHVKVIFISRLA